MKKLKVSVTKKFTFEACHHLPNYNGPCHNLHGHSYEMEVTVSGRMSDITGMILDFKDLKGIVNKLIISKVDHSNLNDFFYNPTAEIMCAVFFDALDEALSSKGYTLEKVKLWETRDSYAEVTKG